jgi:hypothetical protein
VVFGDLGERVAGSDHDLRRHRAPHVEADGIGGHDQTPAALQAPGIVQYPAAGLGPAAVELEDLWPALGVAEVTGGDAPERVSTGDRARRPF